MKKEQYFCDRCKTEVHARIWGRRIFATTLRWWSQENEICLCDECTESFDAWLSISYSLRELFAKKLG